MATCAQCGVPASQCSFSQNQRKRLAMGKSASCLSCKPTPSADELAALHAAEVAAFNRRETEGAMDGVARSVNGRKRKAVGPTQSMKEMAAKLFAECEEMYKVESFDYFAAKSRLVSDMHAQMARWDPLSAMGIRARLHLEMLERAHTRLRTLTWIYPEQGLVLVEAHHNDFLTTLPNRGLPHSNRMVLETLSSKNPNHYHKWGKCRAAPYSSPTRALQLLCKQHGVRFHRTQLDEGMLRRHPNGTVLWRGNTPICMRLPNGSLDDTATRAFLDMGRNLLDSRPTLVRGKSCASISRNFAALGLHMDPNCGAATPHSPLPGHERREMDLFLQLRAAYARWLSPVVHDYASVWFGELWRFLMDNAVTLLAEQVSAVTIGLDFQPVSHTDSDFAPTVLVCVHLGNGPLRGGDFAFAADGIVMELHHGDVLIYNPAAVHGTTEFEYVQAADGCLMFAFFCSTKSLKGCVTKSCVKGKGSPT
jgi:hypothetical protein